MPKNKGKKQHERKARQARRQGNSMAHQADMAVHRMGMDLKNWDQNILDEMVVRLTSTSPGENYHLFVALDANGWTKRLYRRDIPTNNFLDTGNLVGQGFTPYGDFSQQWSANSYLYELYRTKSFGFKFSPATFAGFGSQGASWQVDDPTGVIASEIRQGLDLDGGIFTGLSDARKIKTWSSIRQASNTLNINDLLFAEQQQANLETIDPEAVTPGDRQYYKTGDPVGGNPTRSFLPAIVYCMQFELNQIDITDDRDVVAGILRITARQQFIQRRTEYPSPDKTSKCRIPCDAMVKVLSKMSGLPLQLTQSQEVRKPVATDTQMVAKPTPVQSLGSTLDSLSTAELEAALALKKL